MACYLFMGRSVEQLFDATARVERRTCQCNEACLRKGSDTEDRCKWGYRTKMPRKCYAGENVPALWIAARRNPEASEELISL